MRRVTSVLIPIVSLACLAIVAAQELGGSAEGRKMKNPRASNAGSVEAGKATYAKTCRGCHGDDAKGSGKYAPKTMTPPSDLTDAKWDRGGTDGEIFMVIKNGAGPKFEMKGLKVLTDDQIWDVVNYLRSLGPSRKK